MTSTTTYINPFDKPMTVGKSGTPIIHSFWGGSIQDCNYRGQARRPRVTSIWDVAPGETIEGRLCQKCFGHIIDKMEVAK